MTRRHCPIRCERASVQPFATTTAAFRRIMVLGAVLSLAVALAAPAGSSSQPASANPTRRELIRDSQFRQGFTLIAPKPGQRTEYGELPGEDSTAKPVWDLDQWSSRFPLAARQPVVLANGARRFANDAKRITLGTPGSEQGDIALAVNGHVEYDGRAREAGEPWVHLLLLQPIQNPPSLAEVSSARLHVEARLLRSKLLKTEDYSPDLHAAQAQIFFSVQNRNRASPGYGQYLWFGIPLYDDRSRSPKAFQAQDTGGTNMFIYTPGASVFTNQSAHDGEWISIDKDLLPLMREGLATAWTRGFLNDSHAWADYRIAEMNLGWEVPGLFDVEMQVRNLSLTVTDLASR